MKGRCYLLLVLAALSGCVQAAPGDAPATDQAATKEEPASTGKDPATATARGSAPDPGTSAADASSAVIVVETPYYLDGPQQMRPPDGVWRAGTRVQAIERAGSYWLVQSAAGTRGYVAADAVVLGANNLDGGAGVHDLLIEQVVRGNRQFAIELYERLAAEQSGNLFFSPLNISIAFAMTYGGARGETAKEMAQVFQFDVPEQSLHAAFDSLERRLQDQATGGSYRLQIASRLWGQRSYPFAPAYLQLTQQFYGAELGQVDFAQRPEAARQAINNWVEEQTEQKIENLIPQGLINPDTRLVLTSAIYFHGDWTSPFAQRATKQAPFHTSVEQQVNVPMMFQEDDFKYLAADGMEVLALPYGREEHLSMVVLLPQKKAGLKELEDQLSAESIDQWLKQTAHREVQVYLPRFKLTSQFRLESMLSAMGMQSAFDPQRADFSGISSQEELFLSAAIHKAYVDVNEEGTEAAAATGIVFAPTAAPADAPVVFRADHPFLFLILDSRSGSILFVGRVVNPAA